MPNRNLVDPKKHLQQPKTPNALKTDEDWLNASHASTELLSSKLTVAEDDGAKDRNSVRSDVGSANLTTKNVLALQRTVGNSAVRRLLSQDQNTDEMPVQSALQLKREGSAAPPQSPTPMTNGHVIQREPAKKGLADAAEKASKGATKTSDPLKPGDIPLRRLPDAPIFFDLGAINIGMEKLHQSMGETNALSKTIAGDVEYLAWAGSGGAKQSVEEAKSKQTELYRKLQTNDKLREKISEYTDYVGEGGKVFNAAGEYDEALHGSLGAFYALEKAVNSEDVLKAEEETATAEEDKKKVEAEIKRAQEIAGSAVDILADLVQAKWKEAGAGLGKFLGKELANLAIDAAYSSELQQASEKLTNAKARLGSLKNKGAALAIKEKAELLQKANKEANRKKAALTRALTEATTKRTALTNELDKMGFGAISDAIFMRESMLEASSRASGNLGVYEGNLTEIGEKAAKLKDLNGDFAELLSSPGRENFIRDEIVRDSVYQIAADNKRSLEKIETWAKEQEPENVERIKKELQEAKFMNDANELITWFDELLGI